MQSTDQYYHCEVSILYQQKYIATKIYIVKTHRYLRLVRSWKASEGTSVSLLLSKYLFYQTRRTADWSVQNFLLEVEYLHIGLMKWRRMVLNNWTKNYFKLWLQTDADEQGWTQVKGFVTHKVLWFSSGNYYSFTTDLISFYGYYTHTALQ